MKILFEDESIIVCVKPCGILSQADSGGVENMITLLERYTGEKVFPLHRLDREVGGVMVYAKTKSAAAEICKDISEHNFEKEYYALIHGKPEFPDGVWVDLLFKDSQRNKSFVVKRERKGVKKAELEYKAIKLLQIEESDYSLVSVHLHTGRTHQIRVQFASRRMPLAGDRKYGADDTFKGIGLWAHSIAFTHPDTKENLVFTSEPENFIKDYI